LPAALDRAWRRVADVLPPTPLTAGAGSHALALAYAATPTGAEATVVVSTRASPAKVAKPRSYPITVVQHGTDEEEAGPGDPRP
jgi:threonine dehydratase